MRVVQNSYTAFSIQTNTLQQTNTFQRSNAVEKKFMSDLKQKRNSTSKASVNTMSDGLLQNSMKSIDQAGWMGKLISSFKLNISMDENAGGEELQELRRNALAGFVDRTKRSDRTKRGCAASDTEATEAGCKNKTDRTKRAGAASDTEATAAGCKNKTDPATLAAIDNSEYSSREQLQKWDNLVKHLPPKQREKAAKELNRPCAAAKLALKGGEEGKQAMAYIKANPALYRAIETRAGSGDGRHVMADGMHSDKDLRVFAETIEDRANEANDMMCKYAEKNPDADEQSLHLVRSAALMYANDPILRSASPLKAAGRDGQHDVNYANVTDFEALSDPANNPDLSPKITQAAKLWGNHGMFNVLEDMGLRGKDVARHGGDGLIAGNDFASFIEHVGPKNGGEFADFISYAAKHNATAKVDTSKLDEDVFENPQQYSGARKAAVLTQLQKMQIYVMAGREIRNTEQTEGELQGKIDQLANDAGVQRFLSEQVKKSKKEIISSSPELAQCVANHIRNKVLTGESLGKSLHHKEGKPSASQVTNALENCHDELQLYEDLTGNKIEASDILMTRPDLAATIRSSFKEVTSGELLTKLVKQEDMPLEIALEAYWIKVAFFDDALSKTPNGGIGLPRTDVLEGALRKEGVNPKQLGQIDNKTLKSLMHSQFDALSNDFQKTGGGEKKLLNNLKEKTLKKGAKKLAKQGAKFATRLVANLAGRAAAAVAGQAAGTALAGTISAAAGPVGWVAGAAVSIGFGIAELVSFINKKEKQGRERRDFDKTVTSTLDQFGIAKPK